MRWQPFVRLVLLGAHANTWRCIPNAFSDITVAGFPLYVFPLLVHVFVTELTFVREVLWVVQSWPWAMMLASA